MKYENLKVYSDSYMKLCMKYKRKITQDDSYVFEDGKQAGRWYSNQLYKIYHWRKENKQLSCKQMDNVMLIAELDNFLYDHFEKLNVYERRIEEFLERKEMLNEKSRFTDGVLMCHWFRSEQTKYKKWYQEKKELTKNEYQMMMMFANLENEIYEKQKVKKR